MKYLIFLFLFVMINICSHADWMSDQIHEDLSPFKEQGIKKSALKAVMQKTPATSLFVYISIRKNTVSFTFDSPTVDAQAKPRLLAIQEFFQSLVKTRSLPDVDFLISLHDSFDEELPVPLFVFAKNASIKSSILMPDFEALSHQKSLLKHCSQYAKDYPWQKKRDVVFWRGSTTGGIYGMDNYLQFPRVKLVALSSAHPDWLDAGFTNLCQAPPEVLQYVLEKTRPLCPHLSMKDHFAYKYLIDIDGNSCTYSRCRWILLSNSTLLKPASPNIQWYYKALIPYVHYVPLKEDLSDLSIIYSWLKNHESKARAIAEQGRKLGESLFSKEGIENYIVALLHEYSLIQKNN